MSRLVLDWTKAHDVKPLEQHLATKLESMQSARKSLINKTGAEAEMTGWVDYALNDGFEDLAELQETIEEIQGHSDALVVVGIGGSLLGTKAVYEALTHSFSRMNQEKFHGKPLLFWAGHHLAGDEMVELLDALDQCTPSVVVISKSGGTTEPAMAFRILKEYLVARFGHTEATARTYTITSPDSGTLLDIANEHQYPHYSIPNSIGGRYSVFSNVGLLPLSAAGINTEELMHGVAQATRDCLDENNNDYETNPAMCYAALRNSLYAEGYKIEALCHWSPKLAGVAEWWKQLFGESDGKENTGLYPASAQFSTDLHSLGQYFQEGERHMFATHIKVNDAYSLSRGSIKRRIRIPNSDLDDNFDYLGGKELITVQNSAQQGTFLAHADGGLPTLIWEIPELNAWWLGYWLYTNMFACALSGYERAINPFNQPGVEAYKKNMFGLLGKPGFEEYGQQLKSRMEMGGRLKSMSLTSLT